MNRKNLFNLLLLGAAVAVIGVLIIIKSFVYESEKTLHKNYGAAHMTYNVNIEGGITETGIDAVVPSKEELIKNLKKKGYSIKEYQVIDELGITTERVLAKKRKAFIDICYDLSSADAEEVFRFYEKNYKKYYLMAINETYVYCISDETTFKRAGFKSLANLGKQFIYE